MYNVAILLPKNLDSDTISVSTLVTISTTTPPNVAAKSLDVVPDIIENILGQLSESFETNDWSRHSKGAFSLAEHRDLIKIYASNGIILSAKLQAASAVYQRVLAEFKANEDAMRGLQDVCKSRALDARPITRLPTEIISEILLASWTKLDDPYRCAHVRTCRQWREIVMKNTLFWRNFALGYDGASRDKYLSPQKTKFLINQLDRRLDFVGNDAPLEVFLACPPATEFADINQLFWRIYPTRSRWNSLELQLRSGFLEVYGLLPVVCAAQKLKILATSSPLNESSHKFVEWAKENDPRVKELDAPVSFLGPLLPGLRNLTHLTLVESLNKPTIDLSLTPRLVSLVLRYHFSRESNDWVKAPLHFLAHMELDGLTPSHAQKVFQALTAPHLTSFVWKTHLDVDAWPLLAQSQTTLEKLVVQWPNLEEIDLETWGPAKTFCDQISRGLCLSPLNCLRLLKIKVNREPFETITFNDPIVTVIKALGRPLPKTGTWACPKLTSLRLQAKSLDLGLLLSCMQARSANNRISRIRELITDLDGPDGDMFYRLLGCYVGDVVRVENLAPEARLRPEND